jgi:Icc-related predicted phosphoesterase
MRLARRRRTSAPRGTRVFFATDIHGSEACFRKFLNAGSFYNTDVLILGGDIVGKMLIPITTNGDGRFSTRYGEHVYEGVGQGALAEITADIRRGGHYYVVGDEEALSQLEDEGHRDRIFRDVVYKSISDWVTLAEERLRGTGRRMFVAPGNDDFFEIDNALSGSDVVEFAEARCIAINGFDMITTGYSNPTPWRTDRELPEAELKARIETMAHEARREAELVAVLHAPPYNTAIDRAPALDDELRPSIDATGIRMAPVGSTAVREFIEEHQPLLALHGHVHEGKGIAQIGRTACINPGSEYTQGILSGVIVELGEKELISHQFVAG